MTNRAARLAALPVSLPPRGLSRVEAATYVGVCPNTFDTMVAAGLMPQPKDAGNRRVLWDRLALDKAFSALPTAGGDGEPGEWDVAV